MQNLYEIADMEASEFEARAPGTMLIFRDDASNTTRYATIVGSYPAEGRQSLQVHVSGYNHRSRVVHLVHQVPVDLWPDVRAQYYFDGPAAGWRTRLYMRDYMSVCAEPPRQVERVAIAAD